MAWFDHIPVLNRLFRKSKGERQIVALLPHSIGTGIGWTANRYELANQFRGWNYVAINAIAESCAEMTPRVARMHGEDEVKQTEKRLAKKYKSDKRRKRAALASYRRKFLSAVVRKKAMVSRLQTGDELEPVEHDHRLVRLLNRPNPIDCTAWSLIYRVLMYMRTTGGCYLWIIGGNDGQPSEIWAIPSTWVRTIMGPDRIIQSYEVRPTVASGSDIGSGWFMGGAGKFQVPAARPGEDIGPEGVMFGVGYPHPMSLVDFYSPLTACAEWVDTASSIDKSRISRFQNGSFPGIVIEIDKEVADPKPETIDRLKADIAAKYAGVRRTGEPIILAPGVTMRPVSNTPVEMDWVNSANQMKDWQLAMHKTGSSVVGLAENTTFASMVASRANFFQTTIRPPLVLLGQIFTLHIASRFEDDLVIYWDDPTPSDPAQKMAELNAQYDRGVITPNEYRAEIGREPFPHGGDDPMVPMTLSPIGFASGEDPQDLPLPAASAERWDTDQSAEGMPTSGKPGANGNGVGAGLPSMADLGGFSSNGNGKHLGGRFTPSRNGHVHLEEKSMQELFGDRFTPLEKDLAVLAKTVEGLPDRFKAAMPERAANQSTSIFLDTPAIINQIYDLVSQHLNPQVIAQGIAKIFGLADSVPLAESIAAMMKPPAVNIENKIDMPQPPSISVEEIIKAVLGALAQAPAPQVMIENAVNPTPVTIAAPEPRPRVLEHERDDEGRIVRTVETYS